MNTVPSSAARPRLEQQKRSHHQPVWMGNPLTPIKKPQRTGIAVERADTQHLSSLFHRVRDTEHSNLGLELRRDGATCWRRRDLKSADSRCINMPTAVSPEQRAMRTKVRIAIILVGVVLVAVISFATTQSPKQARTHNSRTLLQVGDYEDHDEPDSCSTPGPGSAPDPCLYVALHCGNETEAIINYLQLYYCQFATVKPLLWILLVWSRALFNINVADIMAYILVLSPGSYRWCIFLPMFSPDGWSSSHIS